MPGRMEFEFQFDQPERESNFRRSQDDPMRILLLGDFSGSGLRKAEEKKTDLANRSILSIDIDNFDDVLSRLAPRAELPLGDQAGSGMLLEFGQLEDFHPDQLYQGLEIFQALRKTRSRLHMRKLANGIYWW